MAIVVKNNNCEVELEEEDVVLRVRKEQILTFKEEQAAMCMYCHQ